MDPFVTYPDCGAIGKLFNILDVFEGGFERIGRFEEVIITDPFRMGIDHISYLEPDAHGEFTFGFEPEFHRNFEVRQCQFTAFIADIIRNFDELQGIVAPLEHIIPIKVMNTETQSNRKSEIAFSERNIIGCKNVNPLVYRTGFHAIRSFHPHIGKQTEPDADAFFGRLFNYLRLGEMRY